MGHATSVNWPVGLGGKGNDGVTQQVKSTEGGIGYVELIYALSNKLPVANLKNKAGKFVTPTLESTSEAAAGVDLPANTDFRVSITNADGAKAYPIASFTWLLVRPDMQDATKKAALKKFLNWMIGPDAQKMATQLDYAPLPEKIVKLEQQRIAQL